MKGAHMDEDEHSPYWHEHSRDEETLDLLEMLRQKWFWYLLAAILLLPVLYGCDDFDRRLAEQEFRQRVFNACVPEQGQRIVVVRDETSIHFTTIDLSAGRYGRKFPHTEIRVATIEEL
jgi:hypothetical protein